MNIFGTPQLARILHPFVGTVMFITFLRMFFRYWRHNLFDRQDMIWMKNIHKIVQNKEVGDTGRYNFGQKCVFWAAIVSLILLLASGIVIWRPYFAPAFSIPLIRAALVVHSVAAVVLIAVIMVHVYAALWVKGTITAMVEGWVTTRWAKNTTRAGIVASKSSNTGKNNRKKAPDDHSHYPAGLAGEKRSDDGGDHSAAPFPPAKATLQPPSCAFAPAGGEKSAR
ncbi:hypothetical protein ERHA55_00310 [Erwinia rhapontici]|nr:hypothetical protein ERHA55_00310 [Erwinia rhapontici]